jgi:hypothetical protein
MSFVSNQLLHCDIPLMDDPAVPTNDVKMFYAVLTTSALFAQHVRNSTTGQLWATYTKYGGFEVNRQQFMATAIWQCLQPHLPEVLKTVQDAFLEPNTARSPTSIHPYLTDSKPNIFSILHLVSQSILDAYVLARCRR